MKIISSVFVIAVCLLVLGSPVHAQNTPTDTGISITVVPSIIDTGGKPGEKVDFSVKVTNNSKYVLPIHVSARPMLGMIGETDGFLQSHNAQQWIIFSEPDFLLDAGKSKEIAGAIVIPENSGPEGFYADVIVRPLGIREASGSVRTQPELTIRTLVRVAGEAIEKVEADIAGGSFVLTSRASERNLTFLLKNEGNVHEMVRPWLVIKKDGDEVARKEEAPMLLLPREARELNFKFPDSVGGGIYEASLEYNFGTPSKTSSSSNYRVYMLPFTPSLLLIIPLTLLGFLLWRYRTRLTRAIAILAKGDKGGQ